MEFGAAVRSGYPVGRCRHSRELLIVSLRENIDSGIHLTCIGIVAALV